MHKHTYFAEDVGVRVVLQQYGGGARVVVACRDVQGRQTHFALGAIVYQKSYHVLVTLLKSYRQRSKAILEDKIKSCSGIDLYLGLNSDFNISPTSVGRL